MEPIWKWKSNCYCLWAAFEFVGCWQKFINSWGMLHLYYYKNTYHKPKHTFNELPVTKQGFWGKVNLFSMLTSAEIVSPSFGKWHHTWSNSLLFLAFNPRWKVLLKNPKGFIYVALYSPLTQHVWKVKANPSLLLVDGTHITVAHRLQQPMTQL